VLLGGPAVISEGVASAVADRTGAQIDRVAGENRFATAAAIAEHSHPDGAQTAYLATGIGYADALAGSAAAAGEDAPLLLTLPGSLPDATRERLHMVE
jgi:putative cell wall-binding protein